MNYLNEHIILAGVDGDTRQVACRRFGDWAVHKLPQEDDTPRWHRWGVTHAPTGRLALAAPSLSTAVAAAKRMTPHRVELDSDGSGTTATYTLLLYACAGLPVYFSLGDGLWRTPLHLPDIMRWTREEAA